MGGRKRKEIECLSNKSIYEVSIVYHSKMVVYANLSSDIPNLSKIPNQMINNIDEVFGE